MKNLKWENINGVSSARTKSKKSKNKKTDSRKAIDEKREINREQEDLAWYKKTTQRNGKRFSRMR